MKQRKPSARISRRLGAALLAAATLWAVSVTAGSTDAAGAWQSLKREVPLALLRWQLGDPGQPDGLSAAAVLTLSQAPLLLSARQEISDLRQQAEEEPETPAPAPVTEPVQEEPQETPAPAGTDNGVPAKTLVPTDPSGYTVCGKVYISNSTKYTLSNEELLKPFGAELTGEAPQILILHSHGSEAYTPAADDGIVWSGECRTTDTRYNVVRMGDAMAEVFGQAGISVLHDRTLYDYPEYAGSYDRSLAAIDRYLKEYPSIRFVLDVHRDAIETSSGSQVKVISEIDGQGTASQLTLVVGSDGGGLSHPDWMENLRLAVAIQEQALTDYPTLMRPLLLRNSRYNQHATTGSLLVEVGTAGNAPEEAELAARLFAGEMVTVLNERSK
ncbi:MAG: stage II sporulation protein P [Clostridiales bacterium]|nr:stage II sporulation protein P [Clostridiales bacterium]